MSQAVKVGLFAAVALVLVAWFILRIEDIELFEPEGQRLAADFESVAGLDDKAAVRVAGVRVGRVDGIELVDRRARVGLLLDRPLELTEGTTARLATSGLLGDRYVELVPGPAAAPPLPEDAVVPGETPVTVDQALGQLSEVGQSIQRLTGSMEGTLAEGDLDRLLTNLADTAEEIRKLVEAVDRARGAERLRHPAQTQRRFSAHELSFREWPLYHVRCRRSRRGRRRSGRRRRALRGRSRRWAGWRRDWSP